MSVNGKYDVIKGPVLPPVLRLVIPRSHYLAITTIALMVSDRDIQAKTKI